MKHKKDMAGGDHMMPEHSDKKMPMKPMNPQKGAKKRKKGKK